MMFAMARLDELAEERLNLSTKDDESGTVSLDLLLPTSVVVLE